MEKTQQSKESSLLHRKDVQHRDRSTSSLNVERMVRHFYQRFYTERLAFIAHIQGIAIDPNRKRYASFILNRLMTLYFIQKKGFLDGDTDYLANRLRLIQTYNDNDSFYRHFLLRLFHERLGTPEHSPEWHALFGNVPYLDGELFASHELERHNAVIQIPDKAFANLFTFFNDYQWLLDEYPAQHNNELNPNILGYIFEKSVNQQQMGAYYTRKDVTEYIAKNTIIPYLFDAVKRAYPSTFHANSPIWQRLQTNPDRYIYEAISSELSLPGETSAEFSSRHAYYIGLRAKLVAGAIHTIDDFITHNLDICQFTQDVLCSINEANLLYAFYDHIQHITILDPTCGTGAFLFAAINILKPLYEACLNRIQTIENKQNTNQDTRQYSPREHILQAPNIIKSIITNSLHGVDIMEEATEICQLRLFLKFVAQIEQVEDLKPLPHISRNIRVGNALVGFTSSTEGDLYQPIAQANILDSHDAIISEQWHIKHQPFHWFIEFEKVTRQAGFNVIIGNPPYVEYGEKKFPYKLQNFETRSCANLYTYIVERSSHLLSPMGRHGMVLPLAAFATKNMIPFIEGFQRWYPCSWLSFYHFRPSMLFSGGKIASIPTTIYLAKNEEPEQRFSTHLTKWSTQQRERLLSGLIYCHITAPKDPDNRHYYPKFGNPCENAMMEKILRHKKISHYLAPMPNQNTMFYRSAGGLYWKVFVNFPWPYQTTSNKQCSFQEIYERDVFVALFNSSLFWWYYTVTFDTFNLKDYMIWGFRFSYPEETVIIKALQMHCQRLMDDFRKHAKHLKRGKTGSYTIYAKKSKAIIDEIDCILAQHYGLTKEELAFLINYDVKYRMGQGTSMDD